MTALTLPSDFEAWARNEVEAGRAADVETLAVEALASFRLERERLQLEAFRASLDAAEADYRINGGIPAEIVFAEMRAQLKARA